MSRPRKRASSKLASERKRAGTPSTGLSTRGRFEALKVNIPAAPPDPFARPYFKSVGASRQPDSAAPQASQPSGASAFAPRSRS